MKYLLGVFALLLLVSTLAFGQSYQPLPFPQEANTALQAGPGDQMAPPVEPPPPWLPIRAARWFSPMVPMITGLSARPFPAPPTLRWVAAR